MNINETNRIIQVNVDEIIIAFSADAHGLKLSPVYKDRLYYYPTVYFDMDVQHIPAGNWRIKEIIETIVNKTVTLIK